jgi:sulfite dehydrogenase (cytochrome) subunit B
MSNLQRKAVFLAALLVVAVAALAQKTSLRLPADNSFAQLKSGEGEDTVRKDCGFCHSTDYIVVQPRFTAQQWDAEVKKMMAVYGAPIGPSDAKTIADYLARNYGAESAPTPKSEAAKP